MKVTTLFIASALIFLFTSPSLLSATTDDLVYDANGKPLEIGDLYFIGSALLGAGEVSLALTKNNETCAFDVILQKSIAMHGKPFAFSPIAIPIGDNYIRVGAALSIDSPTVENPCGGNTIWKVQPCFGWSCVPIITTGGEGNTADSCFKIAKSSSPLFPNKYVLQYSPYACGAGVKYDNPISTYESNDDGFTHLALRGYSLFVSFYRAGEPRIVL